MTPLWQPASLSAQLDLNINKKINKKTISNKTVQIGNQKHRKHEL